MTDSEWLHYRDLKSRCPACKRPAHIAKRDETFYFVDDEYNPFVRHAPVKTTEAVFAVCSALSVTVGYGLVRASDSRE